MARRVVSTRRESDKSLNAASLFVVKIFLISTMNEKKTSIISKIAWIVLMVVKVIFFVFSKVKMHG